MNKITPTYLKKYVKHLFGIDVTFKIYKRLRINGYEYAGWAQTRTLKNGEDKLIIKITERCLQDGIPQWLIWHEVGHFKDEEGINLTEREYNAEMFAIREAKRRRYFKILADMINSVDISWKNRKESRYRIARKDDITGEIRCYI